MEAAARRSGYVGAGPVAPRSASPAGTTRAPSSPARRQTRSTAPSSLNEMETRLVLGEEGPPHVADDDPVAVELCDGTCLDVAARLAEQQGRLERPPPNGRQLWDDRVDVAAEQIADAGEREAGFGLGRPRREHTEPACRGGADSRVPERDLPDPASPCRRTARGSSGVSKSRVIAASSSSRPASVRIDAPRSRRRGRSTRLA